MTFLLSNDIEPCRIHDAVKAWINYDPSKYFTMRSTDPHPWVKARSLGLPSHIKAKIRELRDPSNPKRLTQEETAKQLKISVSSVKTYQGRAD